MSTASPTATSRQVDGVPPLTWRESGSTTFVGALAAATAVTDHPVHYTDVMGWSGLAFRTRWYRGNGIAHPDELWCPSSPCGEFAEDIDRTARQTGWVFEQEDGWGEPGALARATPRIVASIDAGVPVLGYLHDMNVGVIVGYADGGDVLLCHDYMVGETQHRLPPAKLGPWLLFLVRHGAAPAGDVQLRIALETAIANWQRTDPHHVGNKGLYLYGEKALRQWMDDLRLAGMFSPKLQSQLFFVSWWCADCLANARQSAAAFLQRHADDLGPAGHDGLAAAADLYQREADLLARIHQKQDVFCGPWTGKSVSDWDTATRQAEISLLEQCLPLEAQALARLQSVVA